MNTEEAHTVYGWEDVTSLKKIEETLVQDGFAYRYLRDSIGKDGQAFALCSTWLSSAYARLGRKYEAKGVLSNIASVTGELGLMGQSIDVKDKVFAGNFPQGFVHSGFIRAFLDILNG
jgi:GH15 family glucan-1,4-alpha-glucosidase